MKKGKIGIFDSGLGGLLIARAIQKKMPKYDYVYLGDTKRVPYGSRSHEAVYEFTREAVDYLFKKEGCGLVVLACNAASARALRKLQQEYLPKINAKVSPSQARRNVLGVIIPAAEECAKYKRVGVLATRGTVNSKTFVTEILKQNPNCLVYQNPSPMLVPLAEEGERNSAVPFINKYLKPLQMKKIEALVLGCTHYPFYKSKFKEILGNKIKLISQDEVVPKKLSNYLTRHPEITNRLSQNGTAKILVTDVTPQVKILTKRWFSKNTEPELIDL